MSKRRRTSQPLKEPLRQWTALRGVEPAHIVGERWFLVQVTEQRELEFANGFCHDNGIPYFLPLIDEAQRALVWPSYLFCRLTPERGAWLSEQAALRSVPHLVAVFDIADQEGLILDFDQGSRPEMPRGSGFRPGDHVEVAHGPFVGARGVVISDTSRGARVRVPMLGRAMEVVLEAESLRFARIVKPPSPATRPRPTDHRVPLKEIQAALRPIDKTLISELSSNPAALYDVDPRRFEELVAELLADMGFSVHLTPFAKDHGRDILAVMRLPVGEYLTIVDCKRYARHQHIGPDVVQRLMWLADHQDRASHAMVATTTFFTTGALELQRQHRWRLTLADFDQVTSWLGRHGTWQRNAEGGLWLPGNTTPNGSIVL